MLLSLRCHPPASTTELPPWPNRLFSQGPAETGPVGATPPHTVSHTLMLPPPTTGRADLCLRVGPAYQVTQVKSSECHWAFVTISVIVAFVRASVFDSGPKCVWGLWERLGGALAVFATWGQGLVLRSSSSSSPDPILYPVHPQGSFSSHSVWGDPGPG